MKLDMNTGPLKDKQSLVVVVLIAVIVIAGGLIVYNNFFAGKGVEQPLPAEGANAPSPETPLPYEVPEDMNAAEPSSAPEPQQTHAPAPAPSAQPGQSSKKTLTVFGSVVVTYPDKWGIDLRSASTSAILTDGKAKFEIHAPNPTATDAKSIADSALVSFANDGKVSSQGPTRVAGHDAYQYTAAISAGVIRIVGVDSPVRIVLVQRVKGAAFATYKDTFDKMESELSFR